jgi:hypothetical protein
VPAVADPIDSAPSTPDVHALRSAQLRANRNQRRGRLFSRSVMAFLGIGALIAVALIFGRSYLFPTEWDASLTPIVDQIQLDTGVEFDHPVPLVVQPAEEYAQTAMAMTIGTDWSADLPIWRAAGLATGDATPGSVAAGIAARVPVVYDAETDTIYRSADVDPAALTPDLRVILTNLHASQLGLVAPVGTADEVRLTGVSSPQSIAERAIDTFLSGGGPAVATDDDSESDDMTAADLPIPIAYELAAIDLLGEAVIVGADLDPASLSLGDQYPATIGDVLDDGASRAVGALLKPIEQPLGDPVALGVDDWSLVWGAYLRAPTVDRLVDLVVADSFRPIERAGTTCFLGVFETDDEADGAQVLSSMSEWVAAAPDGAQAAASQLGPTRVQLEACDPGPSATGATEMGVVDALLTRQVVRLSR